nr:unnamed protein product [Callosobruchus analis]
MLIPTKHFWGKEQDMRQQNMIDYRLSDFLIQRGGQESTTTSVEVVMDTQPDGKTFTWSRENTLQLLDLYKKYRNEVGSFQIRNFKKLWEIISGDMRVLYGAQVAPSNCENRWRVLERNYKRFIDNQNQTGGGRSETITHLPKPSQPEQNEPGSSKENEKVEELVLEPKQKKIKTVQRVTRRPKTRSDVLEQIRKDKADRFKEKLTFEQAKLDRFIEIENKKIQLKIEKNALLRENNNLLKEQNLLL